MPPEKLKLESDGDILEVEADIIRQSQTIGSSQIMPPKKLKLESSDGDILEVESDIIRQSQTIGSSKIMPPKKLKLESSDGDILEVEADIIRQSQTIDNMISDLPADSQQEDDVIPLPNVNGNILRKVIDWCRHHRNEEPYKESDETVKRSDDIQQPYLILSGKRRETVKRTDDIPQWDQEFLKVDQGTLFELIMAANYLDIKKLLDLCCKNVANMIKSKMSEEIVKTFNIKK